MTTIEAERIGGHVHRYLREKPRIGRVVSVFRHGFNVLFDEGSNPGYVTIQTEDVPLHPWALEVRKIPGEIQVGSVVSAESPRISLGPTTIHWQRAIRYALRIASYTPEEAKRALSRLSILEQLLEEERVKRDPDPFKPEIDATLKRWKETGDSLVLLNLIGLGTGSTPAGDDALIGLIAGFTALENVAHEAKAALRGLRSAPRETRSQTSLPSAQMVAAALDGAFPEPLCDLVAALGRENADGAEIRGLAERLVALGANSGRMMLHGLTAALS